MNTCTHRLIFNPTRGCVMAVAETSRSGGKSGASGTTRSSGTRRKRCMLLPEFHGSNWPLAPDGIAQEAITSIALNGVAATATTSATVMSYRVVVDHTTPGSASCGSGCTHSWTDTFYKAEAIEGPHGAAVIRAGGNITLNASYFGRWCIEAVAAVKAFGLDDGLCLGHEHYPGDLLRPDGPSTHPVREEPKQGLFARFLGKKNR